MSFPGGKGIQDSPTHAPAQGKNRGAAWLRVVPPPAPPRPRRIDVRIAASDGRSPIGRTRALRLSRDDLDALIDVALRMEGRRA